MIVAITGCNGFIGRYLLELLASSSITVVRVSRDEGINLKDHTAFDKVDEFDVLVHLAAYSFVPDSYKNPQAYYTNNFLGTLHALEACRDRGVKMIYVSSAAYGRPHYLPVDETHEVSPVNPYSESKIMGEQLCRAYFRDFQVPICVLRPFNVYGVGQAASFLIPSILGQIRTGSVALKDSRPRRDFIYVKDLVNAIYKVIINDQKGFSIYNVGFGESYSIQELVNIIRSFPGMTEFGLSFSGEERPNEILDIVADISKIQEALSWKPIFNLKDGVFDMLQSKIYDHIINRRLQ